MKLPQRNFWLTTFFVVLTLVAAVTVVSLQQAPSIERITKTVGTYTSAASFDYTAYVKVSTVYGDKETLKPLDGAVYTKLTDKIDFALTYSFNSTTSASPTITYNLEGVLKTDAWQHPLYSTQPTTTDSTTIEVSIPSFIRQEIEQTKSQIDTETGVSSGNYFSSSQPYYVLEITPTIQIEAKTTTGAIHQIFQPTLIVNATHTAQGDIIQIEPLTQTSRGSLTQEQTVANQDVINQQYASYVLVAGSLVGLGYMALTFKKQKLVTPATPSSEKLLQPYRHLIVEATENTDTATTTIKVTNIAELAKAAETLVRPILHVKNQTEDNLYVIEGNTKYQFTLKHNESEEHNPPK